MKGAIFIQESKLHNVAGRIKYISDEEKQEYLYATYETASPSYWKELAKENRKDFKKYGTEGECIEARELIIALPPKFINSDPDEMLMFFTEKFKEKYGVECVSALHHNKARKNLHIHLIFSERKKLDEPEEKIASRNLFFDPEGKRVRTKKEATDERGELLSGHTMIPKGEAYERNVFAPKKAHFKSKAFVHEVKEFYTDIININLEEREKMFVFPLGTPYIPTKKIGKNNPYADDIRKANALRDEWNKRVDIARNQGAPKEGLMTAKRELVILPMQNAMRTSDKSETHGVFKRVLTSAVAVLSTMLSELRYADRKTWADAWGEAILEFIDFCASKVAGVEPKGRNARNR